MSNSECLKEDSNVHGSRNDHEFSKEAVPSNFSQSTVCPKSTFQNTAPFRKTFSTKSQASFGYTNKGKGFGNMDRKLCYVCYSPHHLIKDCDYHSNYLSRFPKTKSVHTKSNNNKPAWTYSHRVNHSNFSKDYRYPHQKRSFQNTQYLQATLFKVLVNQKQYLFKVLLDLHPI